LAWKLAKILKNEAPEALLETYNAERTAAAKQNIACTGQTNLFIAPPSEAAVEYRNDVLTKAEFDKIEKRKINCGRLSVPNIYGKYPKSEIGYWKNEDLAPGRAMKDCFINNKAIFEDRSKNTFLIEKLKSEFTIVVLKHILKKHEIDELKSHNINVLEINQLKNTPLMRLYNMGFDQVYLITPDQYVLGRWEDFIPKFAIDLVELYLSGKTFEIETLQKSEQEIIDDDVTKEILSKSGML
jgi:3-(3-hydroxy-phenyl)propionate hydroxylase